MLLIILGQSPSTRWTLESFAVVTSDDSRSSVKIALKKPIVLISIYE